MLYNIVQIIQNRVHAFPNPKIQQEKGLTPDKRLQGSEELQPHLGLQLSDKLAYDLQASPKGAFLRIVSYFK